MSDETRAGLPILVFADSATFEEWLVAQPRHSKGFWLRISRRGASFATISKPEAVDSALCHGWIDGQQDKYDEASWLTRFTPRKRDSRWSQINRSRALELIDAGRISAAGLVEIEAARSDGRWQAAYAPASTAQIPPDLQVALDASPRAAALFAQLKKGNRYAVLYRIASVKKPLTRSRKIADFVAMLERGERLRLHRDRLPQLAAQTSRWEPPLLEQMANIA